MQDFPANSKKAKDRPEAPTPEDRPKIEPITSAETRRRKRGVGKQFKQTFINGNARSAVEYVVTDVVVPAVRDTMFEAFQSGLERLIYGESARPRRGGTTSGYPAPGKFNYANISTAKPSAHQPQQRMISRRSRSQHDFGEIVIATRREANEVIESMFEYLSRYGSVTVANLYALTDIQGSHVDTKWGWTSLQGSKAVPTRQGGYVLDLPEPEPLD